MYRDMEKEKGKEKDTEEEEEGDKGLDSLEITVTQLTGDAKTIQLLKSSEVVKTWASLPGQTGAVIGTRSR